MATRRTAPSVLPGSSSASVWPLGEITTIRDRARTVSTFTIPSAPCTRPTGSGAVPTGVAPSQLDSAASVQAARVGRPSSSTASATSDPLTAETASCTPTAAPAVSIFIRPFGPVPCPGVRS